jgi:hypothetical protein
MGMHSRKVDGGPATSGARAASNGRGGPARQHTLRGASLKRCASPQSRGRELCNILVALGGNFG